MTLLFIGTTELLLLGGLALLLFGGKKLPEMMRGLGQGVKEFKTGMQEPPIQEQEGQTDEDKNMPQEQSLLKHEQDNTHKID
ncbi:MAG: twin-arginine translocase TatA/TatE family subunit [Muribaculaceae bacterium]|nr:twin-arginine translocase TatA/TatE family subunit [Muribaculaceae bacterium]